MNGSMHDADAQRVRWVAYREHQALVLGAGDDFAIGCHKGNMGAPGMATAGDYRGGRVGLAGEALCDILAIRHSESR